MSLPPGGVIERAVDFVDEKPWTCAAARGFGRASADFVLTRRAEMLRTPRRGTTYAGPLRRN